MKSVVKRSETRAAAAPRAEWRLAARSRDGIACLVPLLCDETSSGRRPCRRHDCSRMRRFEYPDKSRRLWGIGRGWRRAVERRITRHFCHWRGQRSQWQYAKRRCEHRRFGGHWWCREHRWGQRRQYQIRRLSRHWWCREHRWQHKIRRLSGHWRLREHWWCQRWQYANRRLGGLWRQSGQRRNPQ
jgi:hypothetical protein